MPNRVPNMPPAKSIHGSRVDPGRLSKDRFRVAGRHTRPRAASVDGLGLWALSLGCCATALAALALFGGRDAIGAAMILLGSAGLIAIFICAGDTPDTRD
jgi:hypothetical protein